MVPGITIANSWLVALPDIEDRADFHFSGKCVYQDLTEAVPDGHASDCRTLGVHCLS
jgi:hypothetical protein